MDNYFGKDEEIGYFDKLEKKYNWIKNHPDQVRKEFAIPANVKYAVEGVLISKSILASAELRKPKFKTMKLNDFADEYFGKRKWWTANKRATIRSNKWSTNPAT